MKTFLVPARILNVGNECWWGEEVSHLHSDNNYERL